MTFRAHSIAGALLLVSTLEACAPPATPVKAAGTSRLLGQLALDGLVGHGCEALRDRILPIDAQPDHASSGRVWLRECTARRYDDSVQLDVKLIGWQWVDERASGFDVREYVYFRASVGGRVTAEIDASSGVIELHVQSVDVPNVDVTEVGRVSARPSSPVYALLGAAGSLFGHGANAMATDAMRSRVHDLVAERLRAGGSVRIDEALSPKAQGSALLQSREELHPGGALIDGPFPAFARSRLQFDSAGGILARPVCLEEVRAAIDAIISGGSAPDKGAPPSVSRLDGKGGIELGPMPCPWVLVTGLVDTRADTASQASLALTLGTAAAQGTRRFLRVALIAYEITEPPKVIPEASTKPLDIGFSLRVGRGTIPLGPILPSTSSATPWLESAPFLVQADDAIILQIVDADPKGPSLLRSKVELDERVVGEVAIDPARMAGPEGVRLTVVREGQSVGWARVRLESASVQ